MSALSSCALEFDDLWPGEDPLGKCQCERGGGRFSGVSGGRSGGLRVKEVSEGLTCWIWQHKKEKERDRNID